MTRPAHNRPGWYYEIYMIAFGQARITLTNGVIVDENW